MLGLKDEISLLDLKTPIEKLDVQNLTERCHTNFKTQSLNILGKISQKRNEIKKLVRIKVGDVVIQRRGARKPTSLVQLEKGMKTIFFGENGTITSEFPSLKKGIHLDYMRKKIKLNQKIKAGSLTYLFLKGNQSQVEARTDLLKKKVLATSSNFQIEEDKDLDIEKYLRDKAKKEREISKTISKTQKKPRRKISRNVYKYQSENLNDFCSTTYESIPTNVPKLVLNSNRFNRTHITIYSQRELSNNLTHTQDSKIKAKLLIKKAQIVEKKQEKLDNKLCKIIDHSSVQKPLSVDFKKDIEAIMGIKLKQKSKKNKTRNIIEKAVRIQGDYSQMDKKKANMLEISDNLCRMNDNTIKEFGKEICNTYWKKSDGKTRNMPYAMKKKLELIKKQERIRINNNNLLLEKLRYNLEQGSISFHHLTKSIG